MLKLQRLPPPEPAVRRGLAGQRGAGPVRATSQPGAGFFCIAKRPVYGSNQIPRGPAFELLRTDEAVKKRCLITGGAGFIGSHLAEHLLGEGCRVHVIDDLSTGRAENIRHLEDRPDFACTIGSCENEAVMDGLVAEADEVYHLAAAVGVHLVVKDVLRTMHLNYTLTEIVLRLASRAKKPVLIASSSEVYGKGADVPFREDGDLTLGPTTRWRWAYACSKIMDEFMALARHRRSGLPVVVARFFNIVGPRQTGE